MLTRTIFFALAFTLTIRFCIAQEYEHVQKLNGSDKHPQYKVSDDDDRLTKLHKRRINAALASCDLMQSKIEAGLVDIVHCSTVQNRLLNAQLAFHKNKTEKLKVLNEALEWAQKIEQRVIELREAQMIDPLSVNEASVHRIGIEIRLEELKSAK